MFVYVVLDFGGCCKKEWVAMIQASYDSKPPPRDSNIRRMIHASCDTRYLLYDWEGRGGRNSYLGLE